MNFTIDFGLTLTTITVLYMGSSLNGLGNKLCLIDSIATKDVAEIVKIAKEVGVPI